MMSSVSLPLEEEEDHLEGLWLPVDEEVSLFVLPGRRALRFRLKHGSEQAVRILGEGGDRGGEEGAADVQCDDFPAHGERRPEYSREETKRVDGVNYLIFYFYFLSVTETIFPNFQFWLTCSVETESDSGFADLNQSPVFQGFEIDL